MSFRREGAGRAKQSSYRVLNLLGNLWYIEWIEIPQPWGKRFPMPRLDEYLQITDAAEYLGVCRNTLRNWGKAGKITEHRHPINNYRLYKLSELNKLLTATEKSAKPNRRPR